MKQLRKLLIIFVLIISFSSLWSQQNDSKLWYKQPAKSWNEALPVGNGRLGAMVFGHYFKETIQLNEESVWGGYKNDANADAAHAIPEIQKYLLNGNIAKAMELSEEHMESNPLRIRSYQTFGELTIDFFGVSRSIPKVNNYHRELDLETGIASVSYEMEGVKYSREVFSSAPDNVIVIRMKASQPGKLTFRLSYHRERDAIAFPVSVNELEVKGQIIDVPDKDTGEAGPHMKFAGRITGKNKGGKLTTINNSFFVEEADEVVFYLTAATDYNFERMDCDRQIDPALICQNILSSVVSKSYETIRKEHIADHSTMFNRVSFNLGDNKSSLPTDERIKNLKEDGSDLSLITLYFQYGRYLLMGSSRSPGVLPANLQGIWNKDLYAAWSSDFHTNINIQMNYWPAEVCNLSETVIPYSNLITALREPGRVTARKTYNSKGWTMNHLTDPFGRTAISDGVGWGTFPIAGPWLALHQWEHYAFTGNVDYLRDEAYPCMKEAAEFILGYLVEDKNGHLVTAPSNSPENRYRLPDGQEFMLSYGSTMDTQIITELFNACLEAGELLKTDNPFRKELRNTLKKLPPVKISARYNTIQEWIEDYEEVEPGHRHISHLFGLYPGTTINPENKDLFEAARRTIERRRFYNENAEHRQGSYTGWSRAWMINFYARLFDGEEAGKNVQSLIGELTLPNMFNTHPPFQIDGNFGGTAGIAEILLQSHNDEIHLLPALPPSWESGEINGLCARGGFVINMKWDDGKLTEAEILSNKKQKYKVRYQDKVKLISLEKDKPFVFMP